jgi:hypothetical protein
MVMRGGVDWIKLALQDKGKWWDVNGNEHSDLMKYRQFKD